MLPMPFNNPATYAGHSGVDFPQPRGAIFRASGSGVIGLRSRNPRGGNLVWVDYDGYPGVAYAHLDNYTDSPPVGTRVRQGDVIGRVGNSGHSTGPHLHVEIYGHATTAGFWKFFDRNRVVGAGSAAGGSAVRPQKQENDMGTLDNTEGNYQVFATFLQRALKFDVRENGMGPRWELGPTIWEKLGAADDSADIKGVNAELAKVAASVAGIAAPKVDVTKLAAELRDGLAPEFVKALATALANGGKG